MDDALDLPPPGRDLSAPESRRYARNFLATTGAADLVLCGNPELASRLPHGRYEILPTPIDTVKFHPSAISQPTRPTLGWVGHSDNLGYLESIADPLRELAKRHPGLRLVVVADRAPEIPGLEIEFRKWTLASEVSCFAGIGVGLMPLGDTPWARAKCAFKAIQYMSLGIPSVASPVGMNVELFRGGENGLLARNTAEWVTALDSLLSNPTLSATVAAEGRRTVERDYSLDILSRRLVAILRDVSEASSSSRSRA
jgi:glycosyltransferase involved in cell wall biosynthesis